MRVILVGFMGVGKTTVGRSLARRLQVPFVDVDEEVEEAAGLSIAEIFAAEGEGRFRDLEHAALKSVLERSPAVVATGGGLPAEPRNADLLSREGATVWLDAPFALVRRRLEEDGQASRPLFRDLRRAEELFAARRPAYRRAEHRIAVSPEDSPEDLARRIAERLGGELCDS